MKFLILAACLVAVYGAEMGMSQHGGAYNFHYAAGDAGGHRRAESGHGGTVSGSYSYVDPNGHLRQVSYTAGPDGFKPSGDISVDRKTAADAAAIAALAPKAPLPVAPVAPVAPIHYAPYYGHYPYGGHVAVHGGSYVAHW